MTRFKSISYETVKLFVTQFVMGIYGFVVLISVLKNSTLALLVSAFSVLLYFFLVYSQMWELGGKDRIKVDAKRAERDFSKPLAMAIFANLPNLIFTVVESVAYFTNTDSAWYTVSHAATHLLQSYYTGVMRYFGLLNNPFVYCATTFLAILVIFGGYAAGYYGFFLTPISKKLREKQKR